MSDLGIEYANNDDFSSVIASVIETFCALVSQLVIDHFLSFYDAYDCLVLIDTIVNGMIWVIVEKIEIFALANDFYVYFYDLNEYDYDFCYEYEYEYDFDYAIVYAIYYDYVCF